LKFRRQEFRWSFWEIHSWYWLWKRWRPSIFGKIFLPQKSSWYWY